MPNDHTTLDHELARAVDDLQSSLSAAAEAAAEIRRLIPRVASIDAMLDQVEAALLASRRHPAEPLPGLVTPLPTLVATRSETAVGDAYPQVDPWSQIASTWPAGNAAEEQTTPPEGWAPPPALSGTGEGSLVCFRLEFDSRPGPLDLRTVDDAVSEHPAVHDVALLDYDGKHASLKVWIDATSTPAGVQEMLLARASEIFGADNDVTVVALEDAA